MDTSSDHSWMSKYKHFHSCYHCHNSKYIDQVCCYYLWCMHQYCPHLYHPWICITNFRIETSYWFWMLNLHYRNKPDSDIQHSHLYNQYDKDKLKIEVIFMSLMTQKTSVIYKHTYSPNRQHLLDCTPSYILMSCRCLHILSILCRTSPYRQDSSHNPLK